MGLFLTGISFGYFIMLPYILKFLIGFQGPFRPFISINEYFDLILIVLLGLGLIFELPVLIFCLALFNIVTPAIFVEEFSLRGADYCGAGRDHHAHARRFDDVDLHGADDFAVCGRNWRGGDGGAQQKTGCSRKRGWRNAVSVKSRTPVELLRHVRLAVILPAVAATACLVMLACSGNRDAGTSQASASAAAAQRHVVPHQPRRLKPRLRRAQRTALTASVRTRT